MLSHDTRQKTCTGCKLPKPVSDFYRRTRSTDGLTSRCRSCCDRATMAWQAQNAERRREQRRSSDAAYRERTRERRAAYNQAYNAAHREQRLAGKRLSNQRRRLENQSARRLRLVTLKDAAYSAYGGYRCACCGETEPLFLALDHINNDGRQHRTALGGGGVTLYRWLRDRGYPPGFQVLCVNCNWGKHRNGGVCPHEAERIAQAAAILTA